MASLKWVDIIFSHWFSLVQEDPRGRQIACKDVDILLGLK